MIVVVMTLREIIWMILIALAGVGLCISWLVTERRARRARREKDK